MNFRLFLTPRYTVLCSCYLLILASVVFGLLHHPTAQAANTPSQMLSSLWSKYKSTDLDPTSHRTLDATRGNITTSEGESYTMLRAVWENDQTTFNQSWEWSKNNLKRPTDSLPAWLWGERTDGSYGILTSQGGANTASDADTDMALSLVFAANRWHDPTYQTAANQMIRDIWKQDVVEVAGQPVLTADNEEQTNPNYVVVNPSYFAPYAYSIFAKLDPTDNWIGLRTNMYTLVDQAASLPLDQSRSANIPPDWITVNRQTGAIGTMLTGTQTTDYSFDAMRLPFRLALDYEWNDAPEAKALLSHFGFLQGQWQTGKLVTTYDHLGEALTSTEAPSIYGGSLGYFLVINPTSAQQIYNQKLLPLYNPKTGSWKTSLSYYDTNWAWFGLALYNHLLPNLS